MDRRRFLLTSLTGIVAAPVVAGAQQTGKVHRIGALGAFDSNSDSLSAMRFSLSHIAPGEWRCALTGDNSLLAPAGYPGWRRRRGRRCSGRGWDLQRTSYEDGH